MVNLKRPVQIKFRVSQSEQLKIQERMHECGIKNQARYLRLMAINGCIIKPDYTEIKEMNYELHKIGVNINQIAKKVNSTGTICTDEINQLKEMMDAIWQSQKYILSDEP